MAESGRWLGASTLLIPGASFAGPNGLFPTENRNDGSVFSFASATSTITLPAGDWLIKARYQIEDTSNGRAQTLCRFALTGGSSDGFYTQYASAYSRDSSENEHGAVIHAVVSGGSIGATVQFQWMRDTDTPTGGSISSTFEVTALPHSNIGIYDDSGVTTAIYGGVTPNTVGLDTTTPIYESDTAAIEGTGSNTVTIKGDNKLYLIFWHVSGDGSTTRGQRIGHLEYDGVDELSTRSYFYVRNAANSLGAMGADDLIRTSTADIAIQVECFRGPGVAADDGGADDDGGWTSTPGQSGLCVVELHDDAEGFKYTDATGLQDVSSATIVDLNAARTVDFNDAASFTSPIIAVINAEQTMDAYVGANIWTARNNVASTTRLTALARLTLNSVEQESTLDICYTRGNQGTIDTFGGSWHPHGLLALTSGDDLGVSTIRIAGGEAGGADRTQPGTVGFWGLNLDTLAEPVGGSLPASGTPSIASPTASGVAKIIKRATSAVTMAAVVASGVATLAPKVHLNTTETLSGATELPVTSFNSAGTSLTFNDSTGPPIGSLFLGVENRNAGGGDSNTGWIAVDVGPSRPASGTPSTDEITASGVAILAGGTLTASGTPSIDSPVASGIVEILKRASGAPLIGELTAIGSVSQTYKPVGAPSIAVITASGVVTLGPRLASGSPSIAEITASSQAAQILKPSGAATIEEIAASGVAGRTALLASGSPSIHAVTASGVVVLVGAKTASGTPTIESPISSAIVNIVKRASGAPSIDVLTASSAVTQVYKPSGTPSIDELTAAGQVIQIQKSSGAPSINEVTTNGVATIVKKATSASVIESPIASGVATLSGLLASSGSPSISTISANGQVIQTYKLSGTPSIDEIVASGVASLAELESSGSPSIEGPTAAGVAILAPRIWLNTSQTISGATEMTRTAYSVDGTTATFTDPLGPPTGGALFLGVENRNIGGGDSNTGWIAVTVNSTNNQASGSPSIEQITAAGVATLGGAAAAGAPSIEAITASGLVNLFGGSEGFPTIEVIIASGVAILVGPVASGNPSIDTITASGVVTILKGGSGAPAIDTIIASGVATQTLKPSGTPSIAEITASGMAALIGQLPASGSPSLAEITASGQVSQTLKLSGTPSIDTVTASGIATKGVLEVSGTPSIVEIAASGAASQVLKPSGTPSIDAVTASGVATLGPRIVTGTPSLDPLTASGIASRGQARFGDIEKPSLIQLNSYDLVLIPESSKKLVLIGNTYSLTKIGEK